MKIVVLVLAAAILSGCASLSGDLKQAIPDGTWKEVNGTITGKFSATKISATGVTKRGDLLTAEELHVRHSNAWVPMIEFDAIGYKELPKP